MKENMKKIWLSFQIFRKSRREFIEKIEIEKYVYKQPKKSRSRSRNDFLENRDRDREMIFWKIEIEIEKWIFKKSRSRSRVKFCRNRQISRDRDRDRDQQPCCQHCFFLAFSQKNSGYLLPKKFWFFLAALPKKSDRTWLEGKMKVN